jgi:hypothetical protein
MKLEIRPISIAQANAYVEKYHRHHGKKVGCRFAIACYEVVGGATRCGYMLKSSGKASG